jgi:hypothetical protein
VSPEVLAAGEHPSANLCGHASWSRTRLHAKFFLRKT